MSKRLLPRTAYVATKSVSLHGRDGHHEIPINNLLYVSYRPFFLRLLARLKA